jgi:endonuclease/exonuclease/phosphatase family metal-dependent hydrolase
MLLSALRPTILLLALSNFTMHAQAALPIRILTHNIRYATTSPFPSEKPWADRKRFILNQLHYNTLHNAESFICLQEALHNQVVDVMTGLGSDWAYIGVGRDDGKEDGEYSPIIYRPAIWSLESWKTVWLNEDGSVGKKGWDAGSVRIVTIGHFMHVQSKKHVIGMSTHFDNAGAVSRRESAKIILNLITSYNTTDTPFFLAGDLNSETTGEAYQLLAASLQDAKEVARWRYGDVYTFTDFDNEDLTLIDFVFLGGAEWGVEGYSILPNRFEDGVYGSDHRAVVVDGVVGV